MTNFQYGSAGTKFDVLTTELNGTTSGSLSTLGAAKTTTDTSSAIWGEVLFTSGGILSPTGAPNISIWWITSADAGSTFEKSSVAPSRPPDVVIPLSTSAYAANDEVFSSGLVRLWPGSMKALAQNNSGATLPSTGNKISVLPVIISAV